MPSCELHAMLYRTGRTCYSANFFFLSSSAQCRNTPRFSWRVYRCIGKHHSYLECRATGPMGEGKSDDFLLLLCWYFDRFFEGLESLFNMGFFWRIHWSVKVIMCKSVQIYHHYLPYFWMFEALILLDIWLNCELYCKTNKTIRNSSNIVGNWLDFDVSTYNRSITTAQNELFKPKNVAVINPTSTRHGNLSMPEAHFTYFGLKHCR